jgi:hypothetical protein
MPRSIEKTNEDQAEYTYSYSEDDAETYEPATVCAEEAPAPEPEKKVRIAARRNATTATSTAQMAQEHEAMKERVEGVPTKSRKATERQLEALAKARNARKVKADKKKEMMVELSHLKQLELEKKMEKKVARQVRAKLANEEAVREKKRILKELGEMSEDEPILPSVKPAPRVMSVNEYMQKLGF